MIVVGWILTIALFVLWGDDFVIGLVYIGLQSALGHDYNRSIIVVGVQDVNLLDKCVVVIDHRPNRQYLLMKSTVTWLIVM